KGWGATTFGHGIIFAWDHLDYDPIWMHELVHVEQFEAESLQDAALLLILGLMGHWWLGLLVAAFGVLTDVFAANITAWLRGEDAYLGSHLEEAAYNSVSCRAKPPQT